MIWDKLTPLYVNEVTRFWFQVSWWLLLITLPQVVASLLVGLSFIQTLLWRKGSPRPKDFLHRGFYRYFRSRWKYYFFGFVPDNWLDFLINTIPTFGTLAYILFVFLIGENPEILVANGGSLQNLPYRDFDHSVQFLYHFGMVGVLLFFRNFALCWSMIDGSLYSYVSGLEKTLNLKQSAEGMYGPK